MGELRVTRKATMNLPSGTTLGELKAALESVGVPDSATLVFTHYPGDQRDPAYTTFEFRW